MLWTGPAVRDVEAHVRYLGQFNERAARELAISLVKAGDSLAAMPDRGRPGRIAGTRELVALYPYVIVYEVGPESVTIQRIWHGKLLA
ncbi:type II toxin-antitoxin system RelE/ParE family toxin [Skermanella mucosa]|nr:type II toxin-antitoxin system RelE/ParE family toxin [Skermanella mucosa]